MLDPSSAAQPYIQLPVDRVEPNPRQPRGLIDPEGLAALTRSIAADGVVQPVVVRELPDGRYELIAGERRWRAAMAAGLMTIPAVVRTSADRDALLLAIVENVVREDLNAVEVARGYAALADAYGLTVLEIAERLGRSRSAISNTLRLLELPDDVLQLIADGALTEGHGRAILQMDGQEGRRRLARRAVDLSLSVRKTEALARRGATARPSSSAVAWADDDAVGEVIDAAYRAFGVPTQVTQVRGGCRIELVVRSEAELRSLAGRLGEVAGLVETHILR